MDVVVSLNVEVIGNDIHTSHALSQGLGTACVAKLKVEVLDLTLQIGIGCLADLIDLSKIVLRWGEGYIVGVLIAAREVEAHIGFGNKGYVTIDADVFTR